MFSFRSFDMPPLVGPRLSHLMHSPLKQFRVEIESVINVFLLRTESFFRFDDYSEQSRVDDSAHFPFVLLAFV